MGFWSFEIGRIISTVIVSFGFNMVAWGQVVTENAKLLPINGTDEDKFGYSVAIDDGIVVVGAWNDIANGQCSGSSYLFDAISGDQLFKLNPIDVAEQGDGFGFSVSIDSGIVAVGVLQDNENGANSGSAYLFDADTGGQLNKLLASDGRPGDNFGNSISIDNGNVVVGSHRDDDNGNTSGSAYVFDVITGTQVQKLVPTDGGEGDNFGWSVGVSGGVVAVGSVFDSENGHDSGSAYIFDALNGDQQFKILPKDGSSPDRFGVSVAIDNGVVVVGSWRDTENGNDSGSAYLFDASTGAQIAKLLPADGEAGDRFGWSVAIDNGLAVVGAHKNDDAGFNSGSAYLFDISTGEQILKLLPSDGSDFGYFGWSVAIDNGVIVVGANFADDLHSHTGSAYVFDIRCIADLNSDRDLNFLDISAFLVAYGAQIATADIDSNGSFNFLDVSAFLAAFAAGCP